MCAGHGLHHRQAAQFGAQVADSDRGTCGGQDHRRLRPAHVLHWVHQEEGWPGTCCTLRKLAGPCGELSILAAIRLLHCGNTIAVACPPLCSNAHAVASAHCHRHSHMMPAGLNPDLQLLIQSACMACFLMSKLLSQRLVAVSKQSCGCEQVKRTCYAQSSQIRLIRKKMTEIMTREASSCDLKELVGKFIPESIGTLPADRLLQSLHLVS